MALLARLSGQPGAGPVLLRDDQIDGDDRGMLLRVAHAVELWEQQSYAAAADLGVVGADGGQRGSR
ncbi:hypothetical protein ACWD04_28125 [Streptomyces sp. NPDC002911]